MSQDRPIKFLCWQLIKSAAAPSGAAKKSHYCRSLFLEITFFAFGWYLHCGHHFLNNFLQQRLPTELLALALEGSQNGLVFS